MRYLALSLLIIIASSPSKSYGETYKLRKVVIDAGHGGKDPGAVAGKVCEKDIVLDIALKLGKYISENIPDVEVIYTRDNDRFVRLKDRAYVANKNEADLFISIHANHHRASPISGTETYVLGLHRTEDNLNVAKRENKVILLEEDHTTRYEGFDPNSSESYIMFELMQDEFLNQSLSFASAIQEQFASRAKRKNLGVKQAGFLVLREIAMPSVLVEVGYMSNNNELKYLQTSKGRTVIASAIFRAFRDYKKAIEAKSDFISSQPSTNKHLKKKSVNINKGAIFAVQIAVSNSKVETKPENFKGLHDIYCLKSGKKYKYLYGVSKTLEEASLSLEKAKEKYKDAYLVAFKDGKPANINDMRTTQ